MSRSYLASYEEDWQRKKAWLIRGLFHDVPVLSPVREESEPESSPERPASPLPPLIIEREPIKRKHDDSDEYYDKLLKKTKKIYKQLFIDNLDVDEVNFDVKTTSGEISDDHFDDDQPVGIVSQNNDDNFEDNDLIYVLRLDPESLDEGCNENRHTNIPVRDISQGAEENFEDNGQTHLLRLDSENFDESNNRDVVRDLSGGDNYGNDSHISTEEEISEESVQDDEEEDVFDDGERRDATPSCEETEHVEMDTYTSTEEGPSHIQLTVEAQVHVDGTVPSDGGSQDLEDSGAGRGFERQEEGTEVNKDNTEPDDVQPPTESQVDVADTESSVSSDVTPSFVKLPEGNSNREQEENVIQDLEDSGDPDHIQLSSESQTQAEETLPSDKDSNVHEDPSPEQTQAQSEEAKTTSSVQSMFLPRLTEAHTYYELEDEVTEEELTGEEETGEELTEELEENEDPETDSTAATPSSSSQESREEIPEHMRTPQAKFSAESIIPRRYLSDISEENSLISLHNQRITSSPQIGTTKTSAGDIHVTDIRETIQHNSDGENYSENNNKDIDEVLSTIINVTHKNMGSPLGKRKFLDKTTEISDKRKKICKDMSSQTAESQKDVSSQTDVEIKSSKDQSVQVYEKKVSNKDMSIQTTDRGIKNYKDVAIQVGEKRRSCRHVAIQTIEKLENVHSDVSIQTDERKNSSKDMSIQTDIFTCCKDMSVQTDVVKEHFVEASIQTSDIFEELRRDVFLGIPLKIFRICSCTGHV